MPKSTVGEDGANSTLEDNLRLSENLLVLKKNKEKKVTIYGGTPPYQSESTNETLGTVFLEPAGDVITVRTKPNYTGNFSVMVSDAEGNRISMTVDVVDGFDLFPPSRQVYPGRKVQVTPLEGDIEAYEYQLVDGIDQAEVDEKGLVSISPEAPDNTTVTVEVLNPSTGERERSYLYVREHIDSENITMSLGHNFSCLAKTNVNDSSKAIQCWGSKQLGQLGYRAGLVESSPAASVDNTDILVSMASQAVKSIHIGSRFSCATYYNGPALEGRRASFVKCWGSGNGSGDNDAGLYPNTMGVNLTTYNFEGDSGPLYIEKLSMGEYHACAILSSIEDNQILGSGPNDGEIRCWGDQSYGNGYRSWRTNSSPHARLGNNASIHTSLSEIVKNKDQARSLSYQLQGVSGSRKSIDNFPNYVHTVGESFDFVGASNNDTLDYDTYMAQVTKIKAREVSAGNRQTCVIRSDSAFLNQITCWGDNRSRSVSDEDQTDIGGNIFDSSGRNRLTNTNTTFTLPGAEIPEKLIAGYEHVCAVSQSNNLYCWGDNRDRQTNPNSGNSEIPPGNMSEVVLRNAVGDKLNVIDGTAGIDHTCVTVSEVPSDTQGRVMCFGSNSYGQHGIGQFGGSDGYPGDGEYVDLGNRTTPEGDSVPFEAVKLISSTYHTCALLEKTAPSAVGHNVKCWGLSNKNQLGFGDFINRAKASDAEGFVIGDGQVIDLSSSLNGGVCALKINGSVSCWGNENRGILGQEDFLTGSKNGSQSLAEVPYTNMNTFGLEIKKITSASRGSCVLYKSGEAHCWGYGGRWGLGNGSTTSLGESPNELNGTSTRVAGQQETFKDIVKVYDAGCAIDSGDRLRCWGDSWRGLTANDGDDVTTKAENAPRVAAFSDKKILKLSGGRYHLCGVFEGSSGAEEVYCWGENSHGQLGRPTNSGYIGAPDRNGNDNPTPIVEHAQTPVNVNMGPGDTIIDLALGGLHSCVLIKTAGEYEENYVKCWGEKNRLGVSIDPSNGVSPRYNATQFVTPKLDFGGENPIQIAANYTGTCVLFDTERVKCWGRDNDGGLLGWDAPSEYIRLPAPIGSGYVNFGAGRRATRIFGAYTDTFCAILDIDANLDSRYDVKCWGRNHNAQLGLGNLINTNEDDYIHLREETGLLRYRTD